MIRSRWSLRSLGNPDSLVYILLAAMLAVLPACRSSAKAREHVAKGNQYLAQKQFSPAESEYRQAIQINPDFADAYYRLGLLQLQEEDPTAASQSFTRPVEFHPRNLDTRFPLVHLQAPSTH